SNWRLAVSLKSWPRIWFRRSPPAPKRFTVSHKIAVEVVYALPEKQYLQRVMLEEVATVEAAIRASGILELRRDIDLAKNKVGIYSRPVRLADVGNGGDRVAIYRALMADPKELRRQRAEKSGKSFAPHLKPVLKGARVMKEDKKGAH